MLLCLGLAGCQESLETPASESARFYQYAMRDAERMHEGFDKRQYVKCAVFYSLESHETALRLAEENSQEYTLFKIASEDLPALRLLLVRVRDDLLMHKGSLKKYTKKQGSITTRASWDFGTAQDSMKNEAVRLYVGASVLQGGFPRLVLWADFPRAGGGTVREYYFMNQKQSSMLQTNLSKDEQMKAVVVIKQHDVKQQKTVD